MKKLFESWTAILFIMVIGLISCDKDVPGPDILPQPDMSLTQSYPSTVATDWFTLEADLIRATASFGPGTAGRALAYSGLALYESVVPGMPYNQSVFNNISGQKITGAQTDLYWPACANTALAVIMKNLFATAGASNLARIDSLEAANNASYESATSADKLKLSLEFGKAVADAVFNWSKTDGFLNAIPPVTIPTGPGKWIPTPPASAPPIATNWGAFRSFAPNVAALTQPPAPMPYSADPQSDFYHMADTVYKISLSLSADDIALVKTWADVPGNYNGQTHLNKVLTQLLVGDNASLYKAALAYSLHGMAVADAAISVFKTKYTYWLIRPVSYIRTAMGKPTWNTVIPTPPHPEYSAAHAVISGASGMILETFFGKSYAFTDHTHDALYGSRTYKSIREYTEGSGWSRVLAGVHYIPSVEVGLEQGKKAAVMVLNLPFEK
jgi:hypothetical protein